MRRKIAGSLALTLTILMLAATALPAFAAEVPAGKYTYFVSGETGTQSNKIELEEYDDNQTFRDILAEQNYKIVLVKDGAEIKFTPKETMKAVVSYYTVDGSYGGALTWTINGKEEMVSEVPANKTATVQLNSRYGGYTCDLYYVFSFGKGDESTKIIYIASGKAAESTPKPSATPTPAPAESTPTPAQPTPTPTTTPTAKSVQTANAVPSVSKVLVNGKSVSFEAYSINNSTYFKLRDLAKAVNGTEKGFEVGWDGEHNAISLTSGEAYTAVGGELAVSANLKTKKATLSSAKVYLDDEEIQLTAYTIGGNNYFKLRDLAKALDMAVTFDAKTNTIGIGSN
ncbi:stalk domain-containing protein [Gorillibacterium sp. sgz500922]|uniref:stalk domain-containing protein n=1 Tax=Gorillibacterium sp. sgz500922 TaxID=3446694 RepID=UPI003F66A048